MSPKPAFNIQFSQELNPLKWESIDAVLVGVIDFLLAFLGIVAMLFFLFNAYKYLVGAGNTETTGEAKTGMLMAVIGIAIAVGAFLVLNFAAGFFNQ